MKRNQRLLVVLSLVASVIFAVAAYQWDTIWSRMNLTLETSQVEATPQMKSP